MSKFKINVVGIKKRRRVGGRYKWMEEMCNGFDGFGPEASKKNKQAIL